MTELPAKPKYGQPCNHCGLCCQRELCPAAELAFPGKSAPCPALTIVDNQALCGLVLAERKGGFEPHIERLLGIDTGCSMPDDTTTEEEMDEFDIRAFVKVYGKQP